MKRIVNILLCIVLILGMTGCEKTDTKAAAVSEVSMAVEPAMSQAENEEEELESKSITEIAVTDNGENEDMSVLKLYINETEIPVTWEKCDAVDELLTEKENGNIVVNMSMYGDWEQVGSLGHSYSRHDRQMTAVNGDIVLYNGNQIVIFYGSNSWAYTKLGKMNLSAEEITELLSKDDVILTIK